ncbi:unnamed protein product (macronuclear) [Paramecium tetraurelia]|uniref:Uncharacterized protein n=1 Tax=Paramecium tetraurelia TaxID=5888 RepID=A0DI76_PARTE|nr:uncharacterized protein GSPATT00017114001 [Paramecium tetraurelia]CAK82743.1 unnamed protein product [Paramecium tetraurelia]|eukprot:XP_001450140.1 hypothetical protein (macronuclear) [Paramecium tetraurelia strain d4-2]
MSLLKVTINNNGVEIANEEYQYQNIVQLMDELKKAHGMIQEKTKDINYSIVDTQGAEGVKKVKKNPEEEEEDDIQDNE